MNRLLSLLLALALTAAAAAAQTKGRLLVATCADWTEALAPWQKHREGQGWSVDVVGLAKPGDEVARVKARERLRARIAQARPDAVLIAADVDHVATFRYEHHETDLPYGLPDENAIPTIAVGRIPARSRAELAPVLAKIVRYESTFVPDEARNTIHFFAGPGYFGTFVDSATELFAINLLARAVPQHFRLRVLYQSPTTPYFLPPPQPTRAVRAGFEAGSLVAVYEGHGANRRVCRYRFRGRRHDYFGVDDVRGMQCKLPPFFVGLTCSTGDFGTAAKPGLCASLVLEPGGPIAAFGSSDVSYPWPNYLLSLSSIESLLVQRPPTIGDAVAKIRRDFAGRRGTMARLIASVAGPRRDRAKQKRDHQHLYNLFGDPTTRFAPPPRTVALRTRIDGDRLVIDGTIPDFGDGTARVRFDVERTKFATPLHPIDEAATPGKERLLTENHARAESKTLTTADVPIAAGAFSWSVPLSIAHRRTLVGRTQHVYYVRVYAFSTTRDAVGSLAYSVPAPAE